MSGDRPNEPGWSEASWGRSPGAGAPEPGVGEAPTTHPEHREHPDPPRTIARRPRRMQAQGTSDQLSKGNIAFLVAFGLVLVALVVGSLIKVPYAIMSPGPIVDTLSQSPIEGSGKPLIEIDGTTYPTKGHLNFTTVSIAGGPGYPVDVWDLVMAWMDSSREILPVEAVYDPNATREELDEENAVQMQGSQEEATVVALRALGKTVPTHIAIGQLVDGSPAKGVLEAGDRIEEVEGTTITDGAQVRDELQKVTAGQKASMVITRKGKRLTVQVPTQKSDSGRTAIGVLLMIQHDFPVKVTINAGDVGGPSAGLMFSLGIYDLLSEGALTGGRDIAGTGTIDEVGQVGPIGGIRQKLAGAANGGAQFFLAPAQNCNEVVGHVPDGLTVVKVDTFKDALAAVEKIAVGTTTGLPACAG